MMANPRPGQRCRLHYVKAKRTHFAYHGRVGVVEIVGRGKPRNHLIRLDDGPLVVVPCGHLNLADQPAPRPATEDDL